MKLAPVSTGSWQKKALLWLTALVMAPVLIPLAAKMLVEAIAPLMPVIWIALAVFLVIRLGRWLFVRRY